MAADHHEPAADVAAAPLPPLRPRPRLFAAMLVVFALWVCWLIALRLFV